METSFLSKVDPLNIELAYVAVVALALVLAVFVGMALVWPGDQLSAYLLHATPNTGSRPDTTSGREAAPGAAEPTASSSAVAEAEAVINVSSPSEAKAVINVSSLMSGNDKHR